MKMHVPKEDAAKTDKRQREIALEISGKLKNRSRLREDERGFAAEILRAWSERPARKIDGRNRPAFCHGSASREFAWQVGRNNLKKTEALHVVAESFGVSAPAISKAVEANDEEVKSLIETYSRK